MMFTFLPARDRMIRRLGRDGRDKRRRSRSVFIDGRGSRAPASRRAIRTRRDCDGARPKIKSDAAHGGTTESGHQESWRLCGLIGQSLKHVYTRQCATDLRRMWAVDEAGKQDRDCRSSWGIGETRSYRSRQSVGGRSVPCSIRASGH